VIEKHKVGRSSPARFDKEFLVKPTIVVEDRQLVVSRLGQLGVSEELLQDAVAAGQVARDSCSASVPAVTVGNYAWGKTVEGLRDRLIPLGWRRGGEGLLESTVNAAGTVAITVSTGDAGTGLPKGSPRTKHQKGPATKNVCARNQLSLLSALPGYEEPEAPATWVLLVHRGGDHVRCEFSLPAAMGLDGHVDEWIERIILGSVTLGGETEVSPVDETSPAIDIEVKRRAN
jgi:hypothetical protein